MIRVLLFLLAGSASVLRNRRDLAIENLALRQQLALYKQRDARPRLSYVDRAFWVLLSRTWSGWMGALVVVKPETVIGWHRKGFRLYWTWKSRRRPGRPMVPPKVRRLIRKISRANPLWGAPRIHGELLKLGIDVAQATVSKYMVRHRRPPSQTWRAFLDNHARYLVSTDFMVVPTATFRVLFVMVIVAHDRRRIVHFDVTANPTARWAAQQIVEAFPWNTAPRFLLRDRDGIYGSEFRRRVATLGIEEVLTAPRSPWQNPYAERLIGTLRRDVLDHVVVLGERHLRRILVDYARYYHEDRCHLSLDKDTPGGREVEPPEMGRILQMPRVGGLHHRYTRRAA